MKVNNKSALSVTNERFFWQNQFWLKIHENLTSVKLFSFFHIYQVQYENELNKYRE